MDQTSIYGATQDESIFFTIVTETVNSPKIPDMLRAEGTKTRKERVSGEWTDHSAASLFGVLLLFIWNFAGSST